MFKVVSLHYDLGHLVDPVALYRLLGILSQLSLLSRAVILLLLVIVDLGWVQNVFYFAVSLSVNTLLRRVVAGLLRWVVAVLLRWVVNSLLRWVIASLLLTLPDRQDPHEAY